MADMRRSSASLSSDFPAPISWARRRIFALSAAVRPLARLISRRAITACSWSGMGNLPCGLWPFFLTVIVAYVRCCSAFRTATLLSSLGRRFRRGFGLGHCVRVRLDVAMAPLVDAAALVDALDDTTGLAGRCGEDEEVAAARAVARRRIDGGDDGGAVLAPARAVQDHIGDAAHALSLPCAPTRCSSRCVDRPARIRRRRAGTFPPRCRGSAPDWC